MKNVRFLLHHPVARHHQHFKLTSLIACSGVEHEAFNHPSRWNSWRSITRCSPALLGQWNGLMNWSSTLAVLNQYRLYRAVEGTSKAGGCLTGYNHPETSQKRFYGSEFDDSEDEDVENDEEVKVEDYEKTADELLRDQEYSACVRQYCSIPDAGHRLYVVQPVSKKLSVMKASQTTGQLQLDEAVALVSALPRWTVVKTELYNVERINSQRIFGKGQLESLTGKIRLCAGISAVFICVDRLTRVQVAALQRRWGVPVFDRYTIVIQIFKAHARSREAKLQVALAEVPYIRSRLGEIQEGYGDMLTSGAQFVGGTGNSYIQARDMLLRRRERKLRAALVALKKQRLMVREHRQRRKIPTVAVIGYTNSGKTTLIKALTDDRDLVPRNQLFATLDVTAHGGYLPNRMMAVYLDTVGFIANIPTSLINAFSVTLEDAIAADLVVHVRDISHPDQNAQGANVVETVRRMLSPDQMSAMIEVCNKVDKLPQSFERPAGDVFYISAVTGEGLDTLSLEIQSRLISIRGDLQKTLRVPLNGSHLSWLYKEATVTSTQTYEDTESLLVTVVISSQNYARFTARFGQPKKQNNR